MNNEPGACKHGVDDGACKECYQEVTHPVKELTYKDRVKVIGTLKWAEDLLREAGQDEAVNDVQDCIMLLKKVQVKEHTDDEIADLIKATNDEIGTKNIRTFDFTKVLLRKAQEK